MGEPSEAFGEDDEMRYYDPSAGNFGTGLFEGEFQAGEGVAGMSADGFHFDGEEEHEQVMPMRPVYRPVTLEGVTKRNKRRTKDREKVRKIQVERGVTSKKLECVLCDIDADAGLGACSGTMIADAFQLERDCNQIWDREIMYRGIAAKLNRALEMAVKSSSTHVSWRGRTVSVAECRLHFEDKHDNGPLKMVQNDIAHIDIELEEMRNGKLWRVPEGGQDEDKEPDKVNQDIYDKKLARKESLIKTMYFIMREQRIVGTGPGERGGPGRQGGTGRAGRPAGGGGGGGGGVGRPRNQGRTGGNFGRSGIIPFR